MAGQDQKPSGSISADNTSVVDESLLLQTPADKKALDQFEETDAKNLTNTDSDSSAGTLHYGSPDEGQNFDASLLENARFTPETVNLNGALDFQNTEASGTSVDTGDEAVIPEASVANTQETQGTDLADGTGSENLPFSVDLPPLIVSLEGSGLSDRFDISEDIQTDLEVSSDTETPVFPTGEVNVDATDISLSTNSIAESASIGDVVGLLSASGTTGTSFTYSIVSDPDGKFTIDGNQLKLAAGVDYESQTSHSVTIEVDDGAGNTYQEVFSIGVSDVDDTAPTDIALSSSTVAENAGVGTVIGNLSASDADTTSGFTYSIVSDPDGKFTIDGNQLKLAAGVDYESQTSHSVTIEVDDGAGNTYQEVFSIGVTDIHDVQAPDIEDPGDMSGATQIGTEGDDVLTGTVHPDEIWGLGGNDVITGGNQSAILVGGDGHDNMSGGNSGDTLYGGSGHDVLAGENGTDTIYGGSGNDNISGGTGNDTIYGGSGSDNMSGDQGNDFFVFDGSNGTGDSDWVDGGLGSDTIDMTGALDGWTVTLDNGDTFSSADAFDPALLTDDSGTITTGNGATVTFESIESFVW